MHTYVCIYINNSKIMNLKRGVGINHCYKSKETKWKTCTCKDCPIYLTNGPRYCHSWIQHKSHFIPIMTSTSIYFPAKVGIKCCRSYRFVLYPAMMVANH